MFKRMQDQTILITAIYWTDAIKNSTDPRIGYNNEIYAVVEDGICRMKIPVFGALPKRAVLDMSFPVICGDAEITRNPKDWDDFKINRFGLKKLGPTVWAVDPKIEKEPIHAFIILTGCPDPAPWEILGLNNGFKTVSSLNSFN